MSFFALLVAAALVGRDSSRISRFEEALHASGVEVRARLFGEDLDPSHAGAA